MKHIKIWRLWIDRSGLMIARGKSWRWDIYIFPKWFQRLLGYTRTYE